MDVFQIYILIQSDFRHVSHTLFLPRDWWMLLPKLHLHLQVSPHIVHRLSRFFDFSYFSSGVDLCVSDLGTA